MRRADRGSRCIEVLDGLPGRPRRPGARRVRRLYNSRGAGWSLLLWQERLLKHYSRSILQVRVLPLARFRRAGGPTVLVALPVLTLGMAAGFARVRDSLRPRPAHRPDPGHVARLRRISPCATGRAARRGRRRLPRARRAFARHRPPTWPPGHSFRMNVVLVGTPHRLAPVEVWASAWLSIEGAPESWAHRLAAEGAEVVCLSTCNRTEVYVHADPDAAEALAAEALSATSGLHRLRDDATPHGSGGGRPRPARARRGRDPRPGTGPYEDGVNGPCSIASFARPCMREEGARRDGDCRGAPRRFPPRRPRLCSAGLRGPR